MAEVTGKTTTTKKKVVGTISGLNMYSVKRNDPEYAKIKYKNSVKRLRRSGIDVRTKDNPDGRMIVKGGTTRGSIRLEDTQNNNKPYDYPESSSIPGHSSGRRRVDRGLIDTLSAGQYRSGVIEGTIEPVDSAKGSNYNVTRKEVTVEKEVKPYSGTSSDKSAGSGTSNINDESIAEALQNKSFEDASTKDGSGGGHIVNQVPDQISGESYAKANNNSEDPGLDAFGGSGPDVAESNTVGQNEVEKDHTRAPVLVFPEENEDGEPIGKSQFKYLTEEEAAQLAKEGRIKPSLHRKHTKRLRQQERAKAKGNWPYDKDKFALDSNGNLVPKGKVVKTADGQYINADNGNVFTGTDSSDDPNISEAITRSFRAPRIATGIAGVPSEHKVKLYTKDPSWLNRTLETLRKTGNGIVFPYTPTINVNHSANYGTYDINQSVEQPHYYSMTPNVSIQLTAVFTANTAVEAEYMLACMHFLRTSTKSDFGAYRNGIRRNDAGTPPPVLVFSGYGTEMFNNIPVIVRSVNFTLPEDVDYVSVMTGEGGVRIIGIDDQAGLDPGENAGVDGSGIIYEEPEEEVTSVFPSESSSIPTSILFSIDLAPQHPPSQLRDEWNFKDYASGDLLRKGYI